MKYLITFKNDWSNTKIEKEFEGTKEEAKRYVDDFLPEFIEICLEDEYGIDDQISDEEYDEATENCTYSIEEM